MKVYKIVYHEMTIEFLFQYLNHNVFIGGPQIPYCRPLFQLSGIIYVNYIFWHIFLHLMYYIIVSVIEFAHKNEFRHSDLCQ